MTNQYKLILDYPDEIGIEDNVTGDVIVQKVPQNNNTIGFCKGVVGLLNQQSDMINKVSKLNKLLEGFLSAEGYALEDLTNFIKDRTNLDGDVE